MLGTSPLRTAKDARDRPERNAHLLAVLMFYAVSVCKPRVTGRRWIKPSSALAYPLAIIRIFSRWSIPLPGYKMLKAAAAGLSRDYVRYHGPHSLSPVRSEPMSTRTKRRNMKTSWLVSVHEKRDIVRPSTGMWHISRTIENFIGSERTGESEWGAW